MDKLIKILDKLIPLFSTLLGAYITYIVTTSSKKNEIKINSRIEARDDYWIPLAIAIHNLQKKITELTKIDDSYISFRGSDSCQDELDEVLKYLQADKRIYFYKKTRNMLNELNNRIVKYENTLHADIEYIFKHFEQQYLKLIKDSSIYKRNFCDNCNISVKKSFREEIKKALLRHNKINWYGQVEEVLFIREESSDDSTIFWADMRCSYGDFYYDVWCPIKENYDVREDFSFTLEQEIALEVLDYEYDNIILYIKDIEKYMKDIKYNKLYGVIFEKLSLLEEEILENIDSATII